jgi:hypothetical protein
MLATSSHQAFFYLLGVVAIFEYGRFPHSCRFLAARRRRGEVAISDGFDFLAVLSVVKAWSGAKIGEIMYNISTEGPI